MLRQNLSFLLVCLSLSAFSQTYFYARAITVDPGNPTSADNIDLSVFGDLSSSASYISSSSFSIVGTDIYLTLDCATGIGAPVLVPHQETISIGSLAPGNYQIHLAGTGLGDFVMDSTDYFFSVQGPQAIGDIIDDGKLAYDLYIDPDSGLIQVTQENGAGMQVVQLLDMKGNVVKEQRASGNKLVQLQLDSNMRGIFLISVQSAGETWSDLISVPK